MLKLKIIIVFLLPFTMLSQSITGKVYNSQSTVKNIQVLNITKNIKTLTDNKGDFKIKAAVNDSIVFRSLFYIELYIKITEENFNDILVVELKKVVNELDEVFLKNETKLKVFDPIEYEANFHNQLKEDMKRRPYLYGIQPSGNMDFVKIFSLISNVFKSKKPKKEPIITITYKEFDSLFSNSVLFNNKLLTHDLKIPKTYKSLFFEYCDARSIDKKLLAKEKKFILLDSLFNCSKEFLVIISNYKRE